MVFSAEGAGAAVLGRNRLTTLFCACHNSATTSTFPKRKKNGKRNQLNKIMKKSLFIAAIAITTVVTTSWGRQGTEVLHFTANIAMTNDAVEPSASGTAQINVAIQGSADHETLNVTAKGLTPGTSYSLLGATTSMDSTNLTDFTTDSKGRIKLSLSNSGAKKSVPLPAGFGPLTEITEVDIVNTNAQAVLTATSDQTTQMKYLLKKDVSTNNVSGTLQLSASTKSEKFNLSLKGLTPSTDYVLVLNGNSVQTNTASAKGVLKITSAPNAPSVLDLNSVALTDTSATTILSTTVP
jgi:hypothetical protein